MSRYRRIAFALFLFFVALILALSIFAAASAAPLPVTYSSDLVLSACLLASSSTSSTVTSLGDDNNGTVWISGGAVPQWVRCDFGANPDAVRKVTIRASGVPNRAPADFLIEGSDNGSTWTTYASVTASIGWSAQEQRTFTFGTAGSVATHRYWRIYVTALNGDTATSMSEIEMMSVVSEDDPTATPTTGPTNTPTPFPDLPYSVSHYNEAMDEAGLNGYLEVALMIVLILGLFAGLSPKR